MLFNTVIRGVISVIESDDGGDGDELDLNNKSVETKSFASF